MSYWNAKFPNDHGDYEITFASKYKEKTKIVEKVCQAIIDKKVNSIDDISIVKHGYWVEVTKNTSWKCSECGELSCCKANYCPDCGVKMDQEGESR